MVGYEKPQQIIRKDDRSLCIISYFDTSTPEGRATWEAVCAESLWLSRIVLETELSDGTVLQNPHSVKFAWFDIDFENKQQADYFQAELTRKLRQVSPDLEGHRHVIADWLRDWRHDPIPLPKVQCTAQGPASRGMHEFN